MASWDTNVQLDSTITYQEYSPPPPGSITQVTNLGDVTTIINTINGGGGKATGPTITFTGGTTGYDFNASGNSITLVVVNAATIRSSIGAAASGINTDISQLNGASQVDVSGSYKVSGTQVVTARQAAIPDATGGVTIDVEARAAINTLLAELRIHGLIAP